MTPNELADLALLAELKKQQELVRLQPLLAEKARVTEQIATIRARLAAPLADPDDPGALLRHSEHQALLEHQLRERLQALSRIEARIAQAAPALARATARQDVAEKLEGDARKQQARRAAETRLSRASQLTS